MYGLFVDMLMIVKCLSLSVFVSCLMLLVKLSMVWFGCRLELLNLGWLM